MTVVKVEARNISKRGLRFKIFLMRMDESIHMRKGERVGKVRMGRTS